MKRAGSILLAIAVVAISVAFALFGIVLSALTCDESCEDPPEVWSDDPNAWQWDALGILGLATAAGSLVFLVTIILGRRTFGWAALGVTGVLAAAFTGIESASGWGALALAGVVGIGAGAIALTPAGQPRGSTSR